jgi:dipeptidyl aminopeptidase/acylaminoacyl peptidase
MASTTLDVLAGTEGGYAPFWSSDSRSVGFYHLDGSLKHVLVTGGDVRVLGDASRDGPWAIGATWHDDTILFGSHKGRIYRVPATGGTASALEILPPQPGQKSFTAPRFLPDGRHFLVSVVADPALYVAALDTSGARKLMEDGSSAVYAAGYLFYSRETAVWARPFDAQRLEFTGAEVQVTEGTGYVSVSDDGTIVYRPAASPLSLLTWFDRSGRRTGTVGEPGPYEQLVLSPRGRRAVVVRDGDLWTVDLATRIFSRLTTHPADDGDPAWSPDERAVAFKTGRTGPSAVFVKDLVTGKEDPLVAFPERVALDQWTPDGRFVIFRTFGKAVYAMALTGDRTPHMLVNTPFIEDEVHVSPDGRWVAFGTNESERWEVYVAAFPAFTSKRQVSSRGGVQPQWRADGRELFYLAPDGSMMSVPADARTDLTASPPVRLFATDMTPTSGTPQYAVTADGQRFLGLERVGRGRNFRFLLNWVNTKSPTGVTQ